MPLFLFLYQLTADYRVRVGVLLLPGRHFLLRGRPLLPVGSAHLPPQQTAVGVDGTLELNPGVVSLLLHGVVAPIDPELGDPGLVGEDSPANEGDEVLGGGLRAFLLGKVLSKDVVDVVAHSDELLAAVANGND